MGNQTDLKFAFSSAAKKNYSHSAQHNIASGFLSPSGYGRGGASSGA